MKTTRAAQPSLSFLRKQESIVAIHMPITTERLTGDYCELLC
jgi:hypothetical protein